MQPGVVAGTREAADHVELFADQQDDGITTISSGRALCDAVDRIPDAVLRKDAARVLLQQEDTGRRGFTSSRLICELSWLTIDTSSPAAKIQ